MRFDVTVLTQRFPGHSPAVGAVAGRARHRMGRASRYLGRYPRFNSAVKPWYPVFYSRARKWIKDAVSRGEHFDLLHHLTPMAMRYPSPCAGLGLPYVIGPVGRQRGDTARVAPELGTEPSFMKLRDIDGLRCAIDPLLRRTYESCRVVICCGALCCRPLGRCS